MRGRTDTPIVSILGIVALLLGCSSPSPPNETVGNTAPAVEAPSPAPPPAPQASPALQTEYREARAAFEGVFEVDPIPDAPNDENRGISLSPCDWPFAVIPQAEGMGRSRSLYLAFDIAWAAEILRAARIPESYWAERLSQFEQQTLPSFEGQYFRQEDFDGEDDTRKPGNDYRAAMRTFMQQLARDINASGVRRHRAFYYDECGGNPVEEFEIVAAPDGPDLHLISRWSSLVCEGRRVPIYDRSRCRGWRPVSTPSVEPLTGDLLYLAQWREGTGSRGEISFRGRGAIERVTITPRGVAYQPRRDEY